MATELPSLTTWEGILSHMLMHPPPKDEPLPLSNKKATLFGVTLTFMIVAWLAVLFRLWVRVRIVKEFGWDDVFVLLAQLLNTAAAILVCVSVRYGLGRHMLYIDFEELVIYLRLYYVEVAIYITMCAIIKIALLLQYLRIFKAGVMRWICISLLILVVLWGTAFAFIAWFPCFPVRGYWDRTVPAKCYGFGFGDLQEFITTYKIQSATNMMFDIAIFVAPMILFRTPNLRRKNLIAMTGVFMFGAVVVGAAIGRLHGIVKSKGATYPYVDYTWWSPSMIILSCLEIDLAIICASMPIFWPIIERSFATIFVSYEVQVVEERVDDFGLAYELEHKNTNDRASIKSSGTSTRELTQDDENSNENSNNNNNGKKPQFTVGCDPLNDEVKNAGFSANIETLASPPKWQL